MVGEPDRRIRDALARAFNDEGLDIVMFDGPPMFAVGGERYVTLTSFGEKVEGASIYPDDQTRCWTPEEAVFRLRRAVVTRVKDSGCNQLAWRRHPAVERGADGDYYATCRLALLRTPRHPVTSAPVTSAQVYSWWAG